MILLWWFASGRTVRPNLSTCSPKRFFRARAGSPPSMSTPKSVWTVLPRTRGFTRRSDSELAQVPRFFRARAGSPLIEGVVPVEMAVLPRTRGFTVDQMLTHRHRIGSSAHARVHRTRRSGRSPSRRFFRARGFTGGPHAGQGPSPGSSAHAWVHRT
jgi:hypothetical protein